MRTRWLKDGRKVDLVKENIDGKALVAPFVEIFSYYGSSPDDLEEVFDDQPGSRMILVDASDLLTKPPVEIYDEQVLEKQAKAAEIDSMISTAKQEVSRLKYEIVELEKKKGDMSKFIFDMSPFRTAKRIAFFDPDSLLPIVIEPHRNRYNSEGSPYLSFSIHSSDDNIVHSGKLHWRTDGSYSDHRIDPDWPVMFDPTDDELIQSSRARCDVIDLSKINLYSFRRGKVDQGFNFEYLSVKAIAHYNDLKKEQEEATLGQLEKNLKEAQEKMEKYINERK
jgi:hypothetical protein